MTKGIKTTKASKVKPTNRVNVDKVNIKPF